MKIGIDISPLQGPHRMRGIGYVVSNFINNIPDSSDEIIFYAYGHSDINADKIISSITTKPKFYEIRHIAEPIKKNYLPGKLKYIQKAFSKAKTTFCYRDGSKKYGKVDDLDAFIQFDQNEPLAKLKNSAKNCMVIYDLIPYILESDYLWNYKVARSNGLSFLKSVKTAAKRYAYISKIKLNVKKSDKLFAISNTTKQDFIKYANAPANKIEVIELGVDSSNITSNDDNNGVVNRYHYTSWGPIPKKESLKNKKFLLFVGGVDPRRKLQDVVTAFNHLKAQGEDIKLVLSGDSMANPHTLDNELIRNTLLRSSYINDIYFLGFTDNKTRDWLYSTALAFMFPSVYEGVGLPVLEAMAHSTPVIAYDCTAVKEVAKDYPLYAQDSLSIVNAVKQILAMDRQKISKLTHKARNHALKYTWQKTTKSILSAIKNDN